MKPGKIVSESNVRTGLVTCNQGTWNWFLEIKLKQDPEVTRSISCISGEKTLNENERERTKDFDKEKEQDRLEDKRTTIYTFRDIYKTKQEHE